MIKRLIALAVTFAFTVPAMAATLQLDFDYDFSDVNDLDSNPPSGASPWATAVFDDGGSTGSVTLTITNFANEVSGLWFNLDETMDSSLLSITAAGGTGPAANNIYTAAGGENLKADGSGYYDIAFDLPPPGGDRFDAGETLIYNITGAGLVASSFNFYSVNETTTGPYLAAAKFQSTGDGEQSAWVAAVPVPAAVWLFGSALAGLGFARRRKMA